jgi:hypothetical protein
MNGPTLRPVGNQNHGIPPTDSSLHGAKLKHRKGPLQLDLFEPQDFNFDYKVIVTNKKESAKALLLFHNKRGSQEAIFGDAKTDCGLNSIPTRRLIGIQVYTLCSMMAHNLSGEIQMTFAPAAQRTKPKRPPT